MNKNLVLKVMNEFVLSISEAMDVVYPPKPMRRITILKRDSISKLILQLLDTTRGIFKWKNHQLLIQYEI